MEEVNVYFGKVFLFTRDLCILMTAVFVGPAATRLGVVLWLTLQPEDLVLKTHENGDIH